MCLLEWDLRWGFFVVCLFLIDFYVFRGTVRFVAWFKKFLGFVSQGFRVGLV